MRKAFFALFFLSISVIVEAQSISENTKISLLTASPGPDLYSTFGHSAIRVKDSLQKFDIIFNYGTFDFDTRNFYVKFTRGQLDYMLSVETFENFSYYRKSENRSIIEQELNLTTEQKRKLYYLLQENYKPENRYYRYDFFFDNCSSRIRDIMKTAFADDFRYVYPDEWKNGELTFRNLIDLYLTHHHWSDYGIDIALGLPSDDVASPADYMFLPDYLSDAFDLASIIQDGEPVPLVKTKRLILGRMDVEPDTYFVTPSRLMWALFVFSIAMTYLNVKKEFSIGWFDVLYFSAIGIVGWVVFFLWFFTDHIATKDNLNLLWAIPFHFPLFIFWSRISVNWRKWYVFVTGSIDLLILVFWVILPQNYHNAFIPMILIILLRYWFMLKSKKLKPIVG